MPRTRAVGKSQRLSIFAEVKSWQNSSRSTNRTPSSDLRDSLAVAVSEASLLRKSNILFSFLATQLSVALYHCGKFLFRSDRQQSCLISNQARCLIRARQALPWSFSPGGRFYGIPFKKTRENYFGAVRIFHRAGANFAVNLMITLIVRRSPGVRRFGQ